ncbi:MAG: biopolymer transporter ExbD [Prevotella sp.]|nr:biopolymer transporter ExbD [Prevotella sp.]MDD7273480.1 biopolymer transporter ExbD [Prevotellaceae bacterium]MDY3935393.1 biopolymer transporter ExbD [Prevotella sp.]MDY3935416.1 biopolymer transporter ExbD [Prevotella sp.]MDY4218415.1 biopolymer transporter ExbD [Prevotella sp.]
MIFKRRKNREIPSLNTSSLPDLIFTILFFFMLVTQMRKVPQMTDYVLPEGKELNGLSKKTMVFNIYIGHPKSPASFADNNTKPLQVQINDKIIYQKDIEQHLKIELSKLNNTEKANLRFNISADKDTPMGVIIDLKQTLRRLNQVNIHYAGKTEKQ